MCKRTRPGELGPGAIVIPAGPRLGDHVIEADNISQGFRRSRLLIDTLSFKPDARRRSSA